MRSIRGAVGVGVLLLVLEVVTRAELVNPRHLPPASTVLATTLGILADPGFLAHVAGTLGAWALGLLLATAVAVPLGLLMGSSRRGYLAASTTVELLRPIPSVALIPLAILVFGRGLDMKAALVAYAASWPILFNTIYGVRDVDPVARETARSFGLSAVAVARTVALPSAAPFIFTGVRLAAGIGLIVAISSELLAGGSLGIGVWMLEMSGAGTPREYVYAGTVVAGLLGFAIDRALVAVDARLFRWHQRVRSPA